MVKLKGGTVIFFPFSSLWTRYVGKMAGTGSFTLD